MIRLNLAVFVGFSESVSLRSGHLSVQELEQLLTTMNGGKEATTCSNHLLMTCLKCLVYFGLTMFDRLTFLAHVASFKSASTIK